MFPQPYQSIGAEGVNNLASKLLMALFPPSTSYFRFRLNAADMAELEQQEAMKTEIEASLKKMEQIVTEQVEGSGFRAAMMEGFKHLIVSGNGSFLVKPEGDIRFYRLDSYVAKRAPSGELVEWITHEKVAYTTLSEAHRELVKPEMGAKTDEAKATLDLFLWCRRKGNRWEVHQELQGHVVPESVGDYTLENFPGVVLRWTRTDGEDYGRSMVDDVFGDLRSAEALQKAVVEGSAAAAKILILVDPTGSTSLKTVAEAPNLAVRPGRSQDVTAMQLQKAGDFQVALASLERIERRLNRMFLMTTSVTRNAERVTAEEIRLLAGELEDTLGGVYTLLAQELQLPFTKALMAVLADAGKLPDLGGQVRPTVITGSEALGRSHEVNRLMTFGSVMQQVTGEPPSSYLRPHKVAAAVATAVGVHTDLLKTEQELKADAEAARRSQTLNALGSQAIRTSGDITRTQMEQQNGTQAAE